MSGNIARVLDFIAAWKARDLEAVLSNMTADCFYYNIPMEPATGIDAIRAMLQPFFAMASEIEFIVIQIAENSHGAVLTERLDRFRIDDKWIELPVMGTFELVDGRIAKWRDYFDLGQFNTQMAAAAS